MRIVLFLALFASACATTAFPTAPADRDLTIPPDPTSPAPTPLRQEIRSARLPNGLTYFVSRHEKIQERAALWLVVNAGSVQEDQDQHGAAHFVEHMAFAGTTRFPGTAVWDFLNQAGMTPGPDYNATTSRDETVYKFIVPSDELPTMWKGLDLLRDIATNVTFDPRAVDKERSVLLEEWRLRRGLGTRLGEQVWPTLLQGSRYASHKPNQLPESIRSVSLPALRRFYRDWYRPDLMAVVVLGDIDPDQVEAAIWSRFADIRAVSGPRLQGWNPVPHAPLRVTIATDPELHIALLSIVDGVDRFPQRSQKDFRRRLVDELFQTVLRKRISSFAGAGPFLGIDVDRITLTRSLAANIIEAGVKEERIREGVRDLFFALHRLAVHGASAEEVAEAKKILIVRWERALLEDGNQSLAPFANELGRHFLEGEEVPELATELGWVRTLVPTISLGEVNQRATALDSDQGRMIAIDLPAKAGVPTEAHVLEAISQARAQHVSPWTEHFTYQPIMAGRPSPGAVTAIREEPATGTTTWTLANGITVIVKPTTFMDDTISVRGWKPGGTSVVPDQDFVHARFAAEVINKSGFGPFSGWALRPILADKRIALNVDIADLYETVSATTRPVDLEPTLQLLYRRLTQSRCDNGAFTAWKSNRIAALARRKESTEVEFNDTVNALTTSQHLRRQPPTAEMVAQVNLNRVCAIWKDRFRDLSGFSFVFVGKVDPATLQPLVEAYLGSLPGGDQPPEKWRDVGVRFPRSLSEKVVTSGREPKSRVRIVFPDPTPWSADGRRDLEVLEAALQLRLWEELRLKRGLVYHVAVKAQLSDEAGETAVLQVDLTCAPANAGLLKEQVIGELRALAQNGLGDDALSKIRKQLLRRQQTNLRNNNYWLDGLQKAAQHRIPFITLSDPNRLAAGADNERLRATAHRLFDPTRYVVVTLLPNPEVASQPPAPPPQPVSQPPRGIEDGRL